ncbi:hypothetical protein [Micromonospora sp. HK10]|uniref:hypothetical protein n=1 Tax=Micromonospora sp. HK10 TaxID=1538294 RepID=UPI000626F4AD|nr:hypothetical protein [Micromonospora sp. HK10]KKK05541.1 hypothetical protein LQ51_13300 [Micromonospora sp. HK10]
MALISKRGTPTLGFAAAVEALRALGEQPIRLGQVEQSDPPCYFQLFFAGRRGISRRCLGVDRQHVRPRN